MVAVPVSRYTDPTNPQVESLVRHLARAGFVDPDDGTVAMWPNGDRGGAVRVRAEQLAAVVIGWERPSPLRGARGWVPDDVA